MLEMTIEQTAGSRPSMAAYYTEGSTALGTTVGVPDPPKETPTDIYGLLVSNGDLTYSQAIDYMMQDEIASGAYIHDYDETEERFGTALSKAIDRAERTREERLGNTRLRDSDIQEQKENKRRPHIESTPGVPQFRHDTHPAIASLLGFDPRSIPTEDTIANLMNNRRADGSAIPGKHYQKADEGGVPIGFIDMVFRPDKSVSLAWVFAPTAREKQIIFEAHKDAVEKAMWYAAGVIGRARKGKAGAGGADPGHITWVSFDHKTARPTLEAAAVDAQGRAYTEFVQVEVPGDPLLHTHTVIPNVVLTDEGRVGSLDLKELDGMVKVLGAYYQAHIATNLRKAGVLTLLDEETGAARITSIPTHARRHFSKRTQTAYNAAKDFAADRGVDWDALSSKDKIRLVKTSALETRRKKDYGVMDEASWRKQAEDIGWKHSSVLRPGQEEQPLPWPDRFNAAYDASLPLLDLEFQRRAVLNEEDIRVIATRGLIASGITSRKDIDRVTQLYRERGVKLYGKHTDLIWAPDPGARRHKLALTTALHESQETEVIALARSGAADRSGSLRQDALDQAVHRSPFDFTTEHGRTEQLPVMRHIAGAGRIAVVIGVAGSGKSTLLAPLVDAWKTDGRQVIGLALAWRQTEQLADAGIDRRHAIHGFLVKYVTKAGDGPVVVGVQPPLDVAGISINDRLQTGLNRSTVVVVDEVGQVGTRQLLDLLRLRDAHGFSLVLLGDPMQCQSIEAGPVLDLLDRALPNQIPSILKTIRQDTKREREISGLFRKGEAEPALRMKREDGTVQLVAGSYKDAVEHVAALWLARTEANVATPKYRLTVMAPTNSDARAISSAIREIRQRKGEVGPNQVTLRAVDQHGESYDLPLAVGDNVRLFDRINAKFSTGHVGNIGSNGSVLQVMEIGEKTVRLRTIKGLEGEVKWETLRGDGREARIRLAHGDVLTIDAGQGLTSTEHIDAMPSGSQSVNGFKAYVTESRHRIRSYMVVSEGAERKEIARRRPMGDPRPLRDGDVWENIAKNLSRQPMKESATAMLARLHDVRRSATRRAQDAAARRQGVGMTGWQRNRVVMGLNRTAQAVARAGEAVVERIRSGLRP